MTTKIQPKISINKDKLQTEKVKRIIEFVKEVPRPQKKDKMNKCHD